MKVIEVEDFYVFFNFDILRNYYVSIDLYS